MHLPDKKTALRSLGWSVAVLMICLELLFLGRSYFFVLGKVPSYSMQPTLTAGDYVYYTQRVPGRRTVTASPGHPVRYTITRDEQKTKIRHNDVLLFNNPYADDPQQIRFNPTAYYVKRCIGLPGDTIEIRNGQYQLKGQPIPRGDTARQTAFVRKLREQPHLHQHVFPQDPAYDWTLLHFGPLYIPRMHDTLVLNRQTYPLYKHCIEYETGGTLILNNLSVYLDGKHLPTYIFKEN